MSIDFGTKKCGVATTDPLQIIVSPLETVATHLLWDYLTDYLAQEDVEKIVFGLPLNKDGTTTYVKQPMDNFINRFKKRYKNVAIDFQDETMTSVEAKAIILESGIKKSKRRDKTLVDKISAVLILQKYLGHI